MSKSRIAFLWILTVLSFSPHGEAKELTIENKDLKVRIDADTSRFALTFKPTRREFIANGRLSGEEGAATQVTVSHKIFGEGQAIEVTYPNGNRDAIMLFPKLPFAVFRGTLHNGGSEPLVTKKVQTLSAPLRLGTGADKLKTFGTGGLLPADKNPGSYVWQAVVEPESRKGVVFGWLTEDRGSGVLFTKVEERSVRADAQIDYGNLRIGPGKDAELETLAIGYFEDARLGLEAWADTVARVYDIHLPPQPVGYCTWYSQPHGGSSDEKHLAEQAAFAAKHLAPFGFSVVQIDDHWQAGISTNGPKRNFTTHAPKGPYPSGMKAAADHIKSIGLVPGLWFMPFAGTYYDPFFASHPDWFVHHPDGQPFETAWGGACLDMTHPGAREHLRDVVRRIAGDWGYTYFKMDGLWTGTGTKQQYVNSGYKDDNIGDAVFHNPDKSNLEAYRDGLKLVRETVGSNVFILGCNGPQNMRSYGGAFGLMDAMRIGPDNKAEWKSLLRGPTFGSRHYFLHGRIWYNDPDPVYVRESMPLNHAQLICSWVTLSGQLNLSSEWFPGLPPERLDLLKRTMPIHGLPARPADLFEREPPSFWLVSDERRKPRRDVIGIFNWESNEQRFEYSLERLGLDPSTECVGFDYWKNGVVPSMRGKLRITVPAESCAVLAVRPRSNHPQLLSTSRHITQGRVDVLEEKWDPKARLLSGRSKVVANDPYEMRIVGEARVTHFAATQGKTEVKASFKQEAECIRARIESPASGDVTWVLGFK